MPTLKPRDFSCRGHPRCVRFRTPGAWESAARPGCTPVWKKTHPPGSPGGAGGEGGARRGPPGSIRPSGRNRAPGAEGHGAPVVCFPTGEGRTVLTGRTPEGRKTGRTPERAEVRPNECDFGPEGQEGQHPIDLPRPGSGVGVDVGRAHRIAGEGQGAPEMRDDTGKVRLAGEGHGGDLSTGAGHGGHPIGGEGEGIGAPTLSAGAPSDFST
jgi:hypothetical protein